MKTYAVIDEHGNVDLMELDPRHVPEPEVNKTVEIDGVEYELIDWSDPFEMWE